jgi:hypothetical protein
MRLSEFPRTSCCTVHFNNAVEEFGCRITRQCETEDEPAMNWNISGDLSIYGDMTRHQAKKLPVGMGGGTASTPKLSLQRSSCQRFEAGNADQSWLSRYLQASG